MIIGLLLYVFRVKKPHNGTLRFYPKERPTKVEEIGLTQRWNKSSLIENSDRPTFCRESSFLNKRFIKESFNLN